MGNIGRGPEWLRTSRLRQVLAIVCPLAGMVIAVAAPASAATATIVVSGTVSCQSHPVVGVWVESGGGGSGWAGWQAVGRHANIATYQAKIQHTRLPTNIRLHVGCGHVGKTAAWWSDNRTGSTSRAGGALTRSAILNAVCNEGSVRPPAGDNRRCWYGYASAAAAWAVRHLTGAGSLHAVPGDRVRDQHVWTSWKGYCLVFAVAAYESSGVGAVSPIVNTNAKDMYNKYQAAGLIHSATGAPPVGALVFYPGLTSEGHIGVSVGNGAVITARASANPSVRQQGFSSFGSPYKGWAYPTTAFR